MSLERIKEIYSDYKKALKRLREALDQSSLKKDIKIDAVIQRFEFTFELAWKLAKAVLAYNGIEADTPRAVIKEAFKAKLILSGEDWIDMLEDRNRTSHIYDEKTALKIYKKNKKIQLKQLTDLNKRIIEKLGNVK